MVENVVNTLICMQIVAFCRVLLVRLEFNVLFSMVLRCSTYIYTFKHIFPLKKSKTDIKSISICCRASPRHLCCVTVNAKPHFFPFENVNQWTETYHPHARYRSATSSPVNVNITGLQTFTTANPKVCVCVLPDVHNGIA